MITTHFISAVSPFLMLPVMVVVVEGVPKIDLYPVLHPANGSYTANLIQCGQQIASALDKHGAFIAINTDISPTLQIELYDTTRRYFNRPKDEKMKIPVNQDNTHGYETHTSALGDTEESFTVMVGHADDISAKKKTFWPQSPGDFSAVWENYYRRTEFTSNEILKCMAHALGVPEQFFTSKSSEHRSLLKAIHYPVPTREVKVGGAATTRANDTSATTERIDTIPRGTVRSGAHRHFGLITLTKQVDNSGLEIQHGGAGGSWVAVDTNEEELLVNVGELMDFWTGGRWKPVEHRVVETGQKLNRPGVEKHSGRFSFVYYHYVDPKARIDCRDIAGSMCSNPAVIAEDWVMGKHRSSLQQQAQRRTAAQSSSSWYGSRASEASSSKGIHATEL
ncbi:hypothetical protein FOZ61_006347 [Perkinsus olseni]|uniref:Fe2OG dioxygenase domain-containing protein n=1 Tax=Perkinsus olseni TaxID=32597 RepID=A0A7J6MAU6_PEROL|nr:hypothetical protein FOZ61_006347 [Perkinsus olseni]